MARLFNANTSNYISCGTSSTLNPATITISCWYKSRVAPAGGVGNGNGWMVTKDDNTLGRAYSLGINPGSIKLQIQPNGALPISITPPANTNWHHFAAMGPGAGWLGYLDGTVTSSVDTTAMGTATGQMCIGKRTYAGFNEPFDGRLADAAIWNVILTAGEIKALSLGMRPFTVRPKSLLAYWPLDGIQSPEPDLSGNAFNGTINGTVTAADGPPISMFTPHWPSNVEPSAAASFIPAWAMGSNLPVLGTGTY